MSGDRRIDERGWALPTVMAAILVLVLIAVGVASQVRAELKAAAMEPEVAQGQAIVMAALNEVAQAVKNMPGMALTFPDPTQPPPNGWQPCTPAPIDATNPNGPAYCTDALMRRQRQVLIGSSSQNRLQIPVAVRWYLKAGDPLKVDYAWLISPTVDATNITIYYHHRWCRVKEPWDNANFCEQGG